MLKLNTMALGPLETNCYLLYSQSQALVIDPGGEPEKIISFLQEHALELTAILNTHLHFDHIQGNAVLAQTFNLSVLANPQDTYLLDTELGGGGMWGFPKTMPFPMEPLHEGQYVFLDTPCQVLATPGHSQGSLSFYFPELGAVFVGDVLFYRSVGRTDFPGSSEQVLAQSVRKKIFTLPEETIVYPGHGPETTVGSERLNNPFFTEFVR